MPKVACSRFSKISLYGVSLIKERGVLGADVPTAGGDEPAGNTLEMVVVGGS